MIRITVEYLPHNGASHAHRKTFGTWEVMNLSLDAIPASADYAVLAKYDTGAEQHFEVRQHARSLGWLALARRVLDQSAIRFGLPGSENGGDPE